VADGIAGKPETMAERLQRQGYKLLGQFADSGAIRSDAPSPEQQAWAEQAADEIVVTGHKMNWLEKLAYDVGHLFSGGSIKQTAQSSDRGVRAYWSYTYAAQRRAKEMTNPRFAAMSARIDAQAVAQNRAIAAANRQLDYGVALAVTGPAVAAFGAVTAPASLPAFLATSGGEGAYLGTLTRGASGSHISLGSVSIDAGLGMAGGLAGRYVVAPVAGWAAGKIAARFAPAAESTVPSKLAQGLQFEANGVSRASTEAFLPGQSTQRLSVRAFNADGTLAEGRTVLDMAGYRLDNGELGALEFKISPGAPYTARQELHFPLLEQNGGVIVGAKGEAIGLPAGTRIVPTAPVRVNGPTLPKPGEWWKF